MLERPGNTEYYLGVAEAVSKRADCRRGKVGAVIVWQDRIWGTGRNGTVERSVPGCLDGACPRGLKDYGELPGSLQGNHDYSDCIARHAEENALWQFAHYYRLYAGLSDRHELSERWARVLNSPVTLYVNRIPCDRCAGLLLKAGITEVYWPGGSFNGRPEDAASPDQGPVL